MADPADEDLNNPLAQDDAEPGTQGEQQPHGDPADARPEGEGDPPKSDGDDSPADRDPLALAQMESAPEEKPSQPAPDKAETKPPKNTTTPTAKPAEKPRDPPAADDKTAVDPEDLKLAMADLPAEDWRDGKLSHKGKSVLLAQRKVIERLSKTVETIAPLRQAKADLDVVEGLRKKAGLEPAEFVQGTVLRSAIKRGDPRAIPVLEQHLAALRKRAGVEATPPPPRVETPPQVPASPALDPAALLAEIDAAEAEVDWDRLKALKAKLADAAKKPQPKPQEQPVPQPKPQERQPEPAQDDAGGEEGAGHYEMAALEDALTGLGVADPVEHVRTLMQKFPELGAVPEGQRLRAVLEKHKAMAGSQAQLQRRPSGQPLSGRGGPVRAAGQSDTLDPLKHAIRR